MIQAFVGSGGKTGTIMARAAAYRAQGLSVLVTTTTHMGAREDTLFGDDPDAILARLRETGFCMAGIPAENGKIGALSAQTWAKVCKAADVVLVEADGSRQLPLKCPAAHEPVIPKNTDEIVIVCGLSAIGRPAREVCHRLPLVCGMLGIGEDTVITASHVQHLVEKAYRRPLAEKYPNAQITIYPCQRDDMYLRAVAAMLAAGEPVDALRPEWFAGKPKLLICGAGHVGTALATLAAQVDFDVTVLDDRAGLADAARFPENVRVVCGKFEQMQGLMQPGGYVAIMTHGHSEDEHCAEMALRRNDLAYAGMIGSRQKVAKTLENLRTKGVDEAAIAFLHSPIGLRIGAVTPAEIAVSVLAELIAVRRGREASSASEALLACREAGTLCIITKKQGSAPRGTGSMMFVRENGFLDSIGGGIVEARAIEDARRAKGIETHAYTLSTDALGMRCGGMNEVLMIPMEAWTRRKPIEKTV